MKVICRSSPTNTHIRRLFSNRNARKFAYLNYIRKIEVLW